MKSIQVDSKKGGHVAIVTRTKDRPVLLARAFASILAQEHQDWHLYLVNDGGEREQVDELVALYEPAFAGRISVTHNGRSIGMEAASNLALVRCTGDFVAVHDDDDAWHPEFLRQCVDYLNDSPNLQFAAVITNCIVVNERIEGDTVVEESRSNWAYWMPVVTLSRMSEGNIFPPICLLLRHSVASAIGLFNEALPVLGDWDYNLRILSIGDIGSVKEPIAY